MAQHTPNALNHVIRSRLKRLGFHGGSNSGEWSHEEGRERTVRMVLEHRLEHPSQWAAIESIAEKIGCIPQTLRTWVRRHEIDAGQRDGVTTADAQRIKDLERESRELRKANEILKLASAFFAQAELDRRIKS